MKKLFLNLILVINLFATDYSAPLFQFWANLDWKFFFDKFKVDFKLCNCKIEGTSVTQDILPAGFRMTIVEPIGEIEVTNTPWNFVGIGYKMDTTITRKQGGSRGDGEASFRWSHFIIFPPLGMTFGLVQDYICFERGNIFNMAYLSEVNPAWNSDLIALLEEGAKPVSKIWFANPIAEMACAADCATSAVGKPINSLYWCDGCRGSVSAGNSGYFNKTSGKPYEEAEVAAFRTLDTMSLYGGMLKTSESFFTFQPSGTKLLSSLCQAKYFPLIIKDQYYLQPAYGNKGDDAFNLGGMRFHFDFKMNLKQEDDVFFWLWRKKDFCAGAMKCQSTFGGF